MELATIAKPYAKGVFNSALVNDTVPQWRAFLKAFSDLCCHQRLINLMHTPQLTKMQKIELIGSLLTQSTAELGKAQKAFVRLIVNNDRFAALSVIAGVFDKLVSENEKIRHFEIISAYPLTDKQQDELNRMLTDKFSVQASLRVEVKSDLVGGLIIKCGDTVINASVDAQLERLSARLS